MSPHDDVLVIPGLGIASWRSIVPKQVFGAPSAFLARGITAL
jgi:hypothetical protein